MTCRRFQSLASAFADGELRGDEMLAMNQHCRECVACAEELEAVQLLKSMVGNLAEIEAPAGLHDRLRAAVIGSTVAEPVKRPRSLVWTFSVAAVTSLATVWAAAIIWRHTHATPQDSIASQVDIRSDQIAGATQDPWAGYAPVYTISNGSE